jgi:hypothetical protein
MTNTRAFNVAVPQGAQIVLLTGETLTASGSQAQRRPYPKIEAHLMPRSDGNSGYNSLQANLVRRFSGGLSLSMGYTWGRVFVYNFGGGYSEFVQDEYNRSGLHGPAIWDRPHTFFASGIWEIPFLKNASGLSKAVLGGWEVTSILQLASGSPYGVFVSRDIYNLGARRLIIPDRVGNGELPDSQRTVDHYFDVSAFQVPTGGRYGNSALHPLQADGIENLDIGFHKSFALGETRAVDIRVQLFNALNHPIFARPGPSGITTPIDISGADRVNSASTARQIQWGLRMAF